MKNKFNFLLVLAIMVFVLGCNCGGLGGFGQKETSGDKPSNTTTNQTVAGNSNKSLEDKGIDVVVGEGSTGIPECDELMAFFEKESKSPDDNYVTKATKQFFFNKIKESFKEDFEKNKDNKPQMAKNCKQYLEQLQKFKAEEPKKTEDPK